MTAKLLITLCALLASLHSCVAQNGDAENLFESPPQRSDDEILSANVVWAVGSTQTLYWTTTFTNPYEIDLWVNNPGHGASKLGSIYQSNANEIGLRSTNWTVTSMNQQYTNPYVFFLWLQDTVETGVGFTSHYFNITAPVATTTSSSSTSTTSTSTSTTASTTIPTAASVTNATASPTSTPDSDNSLAIGLGVGLGVGIPLLLVVGLLVAIKRFGFAPWKKSSQEASEKQGPMEAQSDLPPGYPHQETYKPFIQPEPAPSEMAATPQSPVEIGPRY